MKRLFIAGAVALCLLAPALPALAADQPTDVSEADQAAALQKIPLEHGLCVKCDEAAQPWATISKLTALSAGTAISDQQF